jgi:MinD-like ATPase involved in chromosome partitioning or flagellar assembly
MTTRIAALVGATGGAGTTRLTVETGALLAATGRDVAVFDAAFETQGMASYTEQRIEADVTALLTGEAELEAVLYEHAADVPGRLALAPAWAPFERLARAETAGAGERFEEQLSAAAISHDVVLVDTPPIGGNQAIAAVDAADRVGIVTPDTPRGADGLALAHERLADIGVESDAVVANRSVDPSLDADAAVPRSDVTDPQDCPACLPIDDSFAPAIADLVAALLGIDVEIETKESEGIAGLLGS